MNVYVLINYQQCELNEIQIIVKYIRQGRPINFTTDIINLAIDRLDENNIKNHWNFSVLIFNKHFSSQ